MSEPIVDPVTEFANTLEALLSVKPPGVSGSKIRSLTSIAIANVKLEKPLIESLYEHLRQSPYSHKLGFLYVLDAIARGYQDESASESFAVPAEAPEESNTAAVYRISQLVEGAFADIFGIPPADDIKEKMKKVIDIWERAETFPREILETIKRKWFSDESTTPPSSPPGHLVETVRKLTEQSLAESSLADSDDVRKSPPALTSSGAPAVAAAPVPDAAMIAQFLEKIKQEPKPQNDKATETVTSLDGKQESDDTSNIANTTTTASNATSDTTNDSAEKTADTASQTDLIMQLLKQNQQGSNSSIAASVAGQPWNIQSSEAGSENGDSESHNGDDADGNSPNDNNHLGPDRRRRSRSPDGRGNNKRIRSGSPRRNGRQIEVKRDTHVLRQRNVSRDPTISDGSIKVLSRTLFIGGVTPHTSEESLIEAFQPYGEVQTMVFQREKTHAFVKLFSRAEAEIARERLVEENKAGRLGLRARWGVGFGPRECCDYQTGISIIPLSKLTEADKRWIVEAEYGGTGGIPLEPGICIEEPDIEIGAGVSSKAISQRMPSNSSRNGPKSSRGERGEKEKAFVTGSNSISNATPAKRNNGGRNGGREDRRGGRDRDRDRDHRGRNNQNNNNNGNGNNRGGGRFNNNNNNGNNFRDQRGGYNNRNNNGNNFNPSMGNFGGPGGMPNMGMQNMNMNGMGGGNGFNLPGNLASLFSNLSQQAMQQGGGNQQGHQQGHQQGNHHNNRYQNRGGQNRHNNNNSNNNMNNGGGMNNNPQQLLAQLSQLTAAAAQFGMGGQQMGSPQMGMSAQYGGGPPQSYGAPQAYGSPMGNSMGAGAGGVPPNLSAALFQLQQAGNQGNSHNQGNRGGQPPPPGMGGGNGGSSIPFNMTHEMAAALLQQHQQQQNQSQNQHQRRN